MANEDLKTMTREQLLAERARLMEQSQQPTIGQRLQGGVGGLLEGLKQIGGIKTKTTTIPTHKPKDFIGESIEKAAGAKIAEQLFPKKETGYQRQRLDFDVASEERRSAGEERRLRDAALTRLQEFGAQITEDRLPELEKSTGLDEGHVDSMFEQGFAAKTLDKRSGKTLVRILPEKERERMIGLRSLQPAEIEFFNNTHDARKRLIESRDEMINYLTSMGISDFSKIDPSDLNAIKKLNIPEGFFSPTGPFSFSARSNIIRQFRDPGLQKIFSKLERAFQSYRKVITGAQASNRELNALRPLITSLTDRPEVFFDTINSLIDESGTIIQDRSNMLRFAGRSFDPNLATSSGLDPEVVNLFIPSTALERGGDEDIVNRLSDVQSRIAQLRSKARQ